MEAHASVEFVMADLPTVIVRVRVAAIAEPFVRSVFLANKLFATVVPPIDSVRSLAVWTAY